MKPLRIAYLMESTEPSGGQRVPMAQADELVARGHRVRIVTKGAPVTWRPSRAEWAYVDAFSAYDASADDFVIGTWFETLGPAHALAGERAVHLCQGYEGGISYWGPRLAEIEAAYALPMPKLVVSRSLEPLCRRFTSDVTFIGQVVEDDLYRSVTPPEHERPRVLLCGQAEADFRGIGEGYEAVRRARRRGRTLDLVRVSWWAPAPGEPLGEVQEFHVGLDTARMTRLVHSCDVLLAPSHAAEGFGLPAAEAMASGIPCVLTAIPSYLAFDERHDYALFAPERDAAALGERLIELLGDAALRERLRVRAREVAEQWRVGRVAERMERFFHERRAGAART